MNRYVLGVFALAAISIGLAAVILAGEWFDAERLGSAALGLILLCYGLIVLLLRKAGVIGPRRTEGREPGAR